MSLNNKIYLTRQIGIYGGVKIEYKLSAPSDEGAVALATEGEKLKKNYFKINLSHRLLMCNITHQNPPPSTEGGKSFRIQSDR